MSRRESLLRGGRVCIGNDCTGSASAGRACDLTAEKLTSKLSDGIAAGRGRQYPTLKEGLHKSAANLLV